MLLLLLLSLQTRGLAAQIPGAAIPPQPPTTVTKTADGLTATIGHETLHVAVCAESVIHVTASPKPLSEEVHARPWMLDLPQSCPGAPFQFNQTTDASTVTTRTLKVTFFPARGNLTYTTAQGDSLLREGNAVPRTYQPTEVNGERTLQVTDRFSPDADNRFPLEFKFTSLASDAIDYYLIYGPEIDQIIHHYRTMTGHAPMFAKWAYGFIQSKDRYISQQEVLDVAHRYRAEHIP